MEHYMSDVRLGNDKVAIDYAQLGAVLERLTVEAQLIQEAPDDTKKTSVLKFPNSLSVELLTSFGLSKVTLSTL